MTAIFHFYNTTKFYFIFKTLKIQYEILIVQFLDKQTQFLRSNHNLILKNYLKQFIFANSKNRNCKRVQLTPLPSYDSKI